MDILPNDIISKKLLLLNDMQSNSRLGRTSHYYNKCFKGFLSSNDPRSNYHSACGCMSIQCRYLWGNRDACTKALVFYAKEYNNTLSTDASDKFMHLFHLGGRYRITAIRNIIPNFSDKWNDIIDMYAGKYNDKEIALLSQKNPEESEAIKQNLIKKNSELLIELLKNEWTFSIKTLLLANTLLFDVHYRYGNTTLLDYAVSYPSRNDSLMLERILDASDASKNSYNMYVVMKSIINHYKIKLFTKFLPKITGFNQDNKIKLCRKALKINHKTKFFKKTVEHFFAQDISLHIMENGRFLYWAIKADNVSAVRYLLTYSANINIPDRHKKTLLMDTVAYDKHENNRYNYAEIALLLLDQGADVMAIDQDKKSVLHHCIRPPHVCYINLLPLITKLIEKGADVNLEDKNGHTAYYYACKQWGPDREITTILKPMIKPIEENESSKTINNDMQEINNTLNV